MFRFAILFVLLPFASADIKHINILSDSRPRILFEKFGFTSSGHLTISVKLATFTSIHDPSRLAFSITSNDSSYMHNFLYKNPNSCLLETNEFRTLFTFAQLVPPHNSFNQSYPITHRNEYLLYFTNCQPGARVTMRVRTEMYNLKKGVRNYLPTDQIQIPIFYFVMGALYLLFLVRVCICLVIAVTGANAVKISNFWTYWLTGGLMLAKALSLICAGVDKQYVQVTGTSHGWDVVFYTIQPARLILHASVLLWIGTTWSLMKSRRLQVIMTIALTIQFIVYCIGETATTMVDTVPYIKKYDYWSEVSKNSAEVCHITIMCSFILTYALFDSPSGSEEIAEREFAKMKDYQCFTAPMIVYMISMVLGRLEDHKYGFRWVAVSEIITFVFSVYMFFTFRYLVQRNILFVVKDAEEVSA